MAADGNGPLEAQAIEDRLLSFIRRELVSSGASVDRERDLLSGDLMDSVAVLRLAAFVAEEFGFEIQPADFVIENFRNVGVLTAYVQRATARTD